MWEQICSLWSLGGDFWVFGSPGKHLSSGIWFLIIKSHFFLLIIPMGEQFHSHFSKTETPASPGNQIKSRTDFNTLIDSSYHGKLVFHTETIYFKISTTKYTCWARSTQKKSHFSLFTKAPLNIKNPIRNWWNPSFFSSLNPNLPTFFNWWGEKNFQIKFFFFYKWCWNLLSEQESSGMFLGGFSTSKIKWCLDQTSPPSLIWEMWGKFGKNMEIWNKNSTFLALKHSNNF